MKRFAIVLGLAALLGIAAYGYRALRPSPAPLSERTPIAVESRERPVAAAVPKEPCLAAPAPPDTWLALGGTLVLSVPAESVALFHVDKGPGVPKRVGEIVGNRKYEVAAISRRRVCVRRVAGNTMHALAIPEKVSSKSVKALSAAVGIRETEPNHFVVPGALLEREIGNLYHLLESALAVPEVDSNGKFGFRLKRIEPGSLFLSLGLEPGDLLRGVNDLVFESPADGLVAFQKMLHSKRVELKLIRSGRPTKLIFDVTK